MEQMDLDGDAHAVTVEKFALDLLEPSHPALQPEELLHLLLLQQCMELQIKL